MTLEAEQAAPPAVESLPSIEDMRAADAAPAPEPVAPEPAPEPAPEAQAEPQRVPLATFLEEKRAAKEAREEAKRLREQMEEGNKRLAALMERLAPPPAPPQVPDLNTDPVAHFKAEIETLKAETAAQRERREQVERQAAFVNQYRVAAAEFARETPDFQAAYTHAITALRADAAMFGMPPEQAEAQIVQVAFANGRNPAQALYDFAKSRGYAAPAPAANADKALETLERGQAAARGATTAPGRAPAPTLDLAALANMPQAEFAKLLANDPEKVIRAMGG